MTADEAPLESIAGAILDGMAIDWAAAESSTEEADRPVLSRLKQIAAIAEAHRTEGPETWGHLRILERVGQGAFGEVYRAWDSRLDREVALKLLRAEHEPGRHQAMSIIEEGRLLARIHHPNVVTIYGAERIDGRIGLWMECIAGQTLHQMIAEGKRFTPAEVVRIGRQICSAASAVHGAGLVHRDVKAQNVMLSSEGRVVLMDFGTGRERAESGHSGMAGTPLYLAPEILDGRSGASARSDLYSIGVVLFFLLTGSYPVRGRSIAELRAAHQQGRRSAVRTELSEVPRNLSRVIERAIDPDPQNRYESAAALDSALAAIESPVVSRGLHRIAAAALLIVAIIAAGVFSWRSGAFAPAGGPAQIAVLPFSSNGGDPDSEYLGDGLTDEIIRSLATVEGLDLRSRNSSFAFKNRERNPKAIRRQLGVDYVLDGSVVRAGGQLLVDAWLDNVNTGRRLWADRFERELSMSALETIGDDIASGIAKALQLRLEHPRRRYATNLETYELYLRARDLAERRGSDTRLAVELFEKVIQADPDYTPAYAGLVIAYAYMSMQPYQMVSFETAHAIMRSAAIKAVALDAELAEAHAARGWVHARELQWAEAEAAFDRALNLNPTLTLVSVGLVHSTLRPVGKLRKAEALLREAARLDPLSSGPVQRELGYLLLQDGRAAEAINVLEPIRHADSDLPDVDMVLGRALVMAGRAEESLPLLERRRERLIDGTSDVHPWVAFAYVKLGRRTDAEELARRNDHLPFRRVIINAALGNVDRMFRGLNEMVEREPQRAGHLLRAPELEAYRTDERYRRVLQRLKLPNE